MVPAFSPALSASLSESNAGDLEGKRIGGGEMVSSQVRAGDFGGPKVEKVIKQLGSGGPCPPKRFCLERATTEIDPRHRAERGRVRWQWGLPEGRSKLTAWNVRLHWRMWCQGSEVGQTVTLSV